MRYHFADFELDLAQRELRHRGVARALQPQAFEFLVQLVRARERMLTKRELIDTLWPDTVVSDGSLQRVASQARSALGPEGRELVKTFAGLGYRFIGEVREVEAPPRAAPRFRPRYAKSGDVHIAYHTAGEGDVDIVLVLGWALPMEALHTAPSADGSGTIVEALAALSRVITFDKRGTGMSDRVKALPDLDLRMDDLRAVLDEVRSERAILLGISEGGPLSIAFAAAYPERVAGLVLVGAFPRMASAPDYPHGWKRSELGRLAAYVKSSWGAGATLSALVPAHEQARLRDWAAASERAGASPGAALDLLEMNASIDVRDRLAQLRVPTVVLHARADRVAAIENGRFLAAHIPGAELVEIDGDDHTCTFAGRAQLLAAVARLLARESAT